MSNRLSVSENRVLKKMFGPKQEEVTGDWRKLHNEELHGLYFLSYVMRVGRSRRLKWTGLVS
jgi:hypothetical protein